MSADDAAYLLADAEDRRAALHEASIIAVTRGDVGLLTGETALLAIAERNYHFLRNRDTLRAVAIQIVPGTPHKEGTPDMATVFNLADTDEVVFSLTGLDAKDAAVPLPAGFTAAWSLADPDSTGAVLTASADTSTATLAAGVPDTNLMVNVSVTIANPDGSTSTLLGAEAVIVTATAPTTVGIVPGTPTPETPATPPAG